MKFKAPKTIANHPAVEECLDGFEEGGDRKYNIWLKPEYAFLNGRTAGCRELFANSVSEFLYAKPVKRELAKDEIIAAGRVK